MKSTHSDEYQRVITALASARKDRGVLQTEIATRLDKPQSFISKVENRERRIDVAEFVQICGVIGVSPVAILKQAGLVTDDD